MIAWFMVSLGRFVINFVIISLKVVCLNFCHENRRLDDGVLRACGDPTLL